MTSFNKRIYEMLIRIQVFAERYRQLFVKDSPIGQSLAEIDAAVLKLSAHKTSQASGKGDTRVSTEDRAGARAALRNQLDAISRTAKGLKLGEFWLSRDKSDRSLVEMGRMFAARAEPLKQLFIDSHMAPGFIDTLNIAVANLEKTIKDQVFKEGTRIAATSAINEAQNAALAVLVRLDPLMENRLRDDPPTLRLWQSARHVERYAKSRRRDSQPAAEDPPLPGNGATDPKP